MALKENKIVNLFDDKDAKEIFGYDTSIDMESSILPPLILKNIQFSSKIDIYNFLDVALLKYDIANQTYLKYKNLYNFMEDDIKKEELKLYIKILSGVPFQINNLWYKRASKKSENGTEIEVNGKTVTLIDITDSAIKQYTNDIAVNIINSKYSETFKDVQKKIDNYKYLALYSWNIIKISESLLMSYSNDNKVRNSTYKKNNENYEIAKAFEGD